MTQRIDRIAQLLNCPVLGEDIRRAITDTRKEVLTDEEDESEHDTDDVPTPSSKGARPRPAAQRPARTPARARPLAYKACS